MESFVDALGHSNVEASMPKAGRFRPDADAKAKDMSAVEHLIAAQLLVTPEACASEADLRRILARTAEANVWLEMAEEIAHLGHWRLNLPGQEVSWSNEVYRIFGVTRDTHVPDVSSALAFYHPDDRDKVDRALKAAIGTGTGYNYSARIFRPDGGIRHVMCLGVTRLGPDGKPAGLFGVIRDVTQEHEMEQALRRANARLEQIAHEDALTGLANRRRFDETLAAEWRRTRRNGQPLSLVLADVDSFKLFNDTYGHPAGDACLQRVAAVLASTACRSGDLAARYGGEELALVLPCTGLASAAKVAEDFRHGIQALGIPHDGSPAYGVVTVSIGVATAHPPGLPGMGSPAELIEEADRILYEAKRSGRNRVVSAASLLRERDAQPPDGEAARLATLAAYEKAGATRRSREMDRIARLAAKMAGTPIGLVTLVGKDSQTFAGNFGLEEISGTSREVSFCTHTLREAEPLVVADATRDPRFHDNPLVTGDLGIRFYAGAPVISRRTGQRLGAVCVIDKTPHAGTGAAQREMLKDMARMAAEILEEAAEAGAA
jgi:diguanylate cyclase (GGDEF)-like protein/PAS domain S-box-containing protein